MDIVITIKGAFKRIVELSFLFVILLIIFDSASLIHSGHVFLLDSKLELFSGIIIVTFAICFTIIVLRRYHYVLSCNGIRLTQRGHLHEISWTDVHTLDHRSFGGHSDGFIMKFMGNNQEVRIFLSPLITEDYGIVIRTILEYLPDEKITESARRSKEWLHFQTAKQSLI